MGGLGDLETLGRLAVLLLLQERPTHRLLLLPLHPSVVSLLLLLQALVLHADGWTRTEQQ